MSCCLPTVEMPALIPSLRSADPVDPRLALLWPFCSQSPGRPEPWGLGASLSLGPAQNLLIYSTRESTVLSPGITFWWVWCVVPGNGPVRR